MGATNDFQVYSSEYARDKYARHEMEWVGRGVVLRHPRSDTFPWLMRRKNANKILQEMIFIQHNLGLL